MKRWCPDAPEACGADRRTRHDLIWECVALRHQLAGLKRCRTRRPCFRPIDRLFWVFLSCPAGAKPLPSFKPTISHPHCRRERGVAEPEQSGRMAICPQVQMPTGHNTKTARCWCWADGMSLHGVAFLGVRIREPTGSRYATPLL